MPITQTVTVAPVGAVASDGHAAGNTVARTTMPNIVINAIGCRSLQLPASAEQTKRRCSA